MIKRIILGVNTNPNYYGLLPLVIKAYKKFFSDFILTIAVVGEYRKFPANIKRCFSGTPCAFYPEIDGVPTGNLAKIVRLYEAATCYNEICVVNDVDIIPLQRKYFIRRFVHRKKNNMLIIGREWYNNTKSKGKFPMCWVTAEGYLFSNVVNPKKLKWDKWVKSLFDYKSVDGKEKVNQPFNRFSDESLLLGMLRKYKISMQHFRKYPIKNKPTCVVSQKLPLNVKHLQNGNYVEAHHLMSIDKNENKLIAINRFLNDA